MDSSHPHTRIRTVPTRVGCCISSVWVFTHWRMFSPGSFGTFLHFFRALFLRLAWWSVLPSETFFSNLGPAGSFKIHNISVGWRATSCSRDPSALGASSLFHITELSGGRYQGSIGITSSDWGQDTSIRLWVERNSFKNMSFILIQFPFSCYHKPLWSLFIVSSCNEYV